jgi:hypothetical protein
MQLGCFDALILDCLVDGGHSQANLDRRKNRCHSVSSCVAPETAWIHELHLFAQAVLSFDRIANSVTTILRVEITPFLHLSHDLGEIPILDALSDPA